MSRRLGKKQVTFVLLAIIAFITVLSLLRWQNNVQSSNTKYNLIIISIDTLRPDHMGVYGYSKNTTPNIDNWAKKNATTFTNAYTATPMTYPSFVSLMTGTLPWEIGIYSNGNTLQEDGDVIHDVKVGNQNIPTSTLTLAEVLRNNGYHTAAYVSNGILGKSVTNIAKGFESYTLNDVADDPNSTSKKTFDNTLQFLRSEASAKQPFFLWTHITDPHYPYWPPKDIACKFASTDICQQIKHMSMAKLDQRWMSMQGCRLNAPSAADTQLYESLYDGDIAVSDTYVEQILSQIKQQGLDKNSVIVIYGDHGEGFDHNYYFTHSHLTYESQVHIPLIISYPGSKQEGKENSQVIQNAQIMPTVVKLLGIKAPQSFSLPDFASAIDPARFQAYPPVQAFYFMNSLDNQFAIREGSYKYIYTLPMRMEDCMKTYGQEQLYDLANDPGEKENLVSAMPQRAAAMKFQLLSYLRQYSPDLSNLPVQILPTGESERDQQQILKNLQKLGY